MRARAALIFLQAIDSLSNVLGYKLTLVPIEEMVDVVTIKRRHNMSTLVPGGWIRIKRGKYAGDLSQVPRRHRFALLVPVTQHFLCCRYSK